jgi:hypothetical protein
MRRSFAAQWISTLVMASLVTLPGVAAAQNQQAPPASGQTTAPQAPPPPDQTPPPQAPVTQTPAGQTPPTPPPAVSQQDSPNVKSGSEADVNAIGNRKVGHGPEMYSLEHDIAIGKQLSQEVEKSAKFINDPVINEYVNRVGQNLVRNSDAQVPFTIKVIDSDVVNAFALPGGFFYVNSGLILHADEESELAGVMAHEIAHVCARHGTREETKSTIVQLASIPAMIFIPYSWAGYAI